MSDTPQRKVEDIVSDWLVDCGEERTSSSGASYYKIHYKGLSESFEVLLDKLLADNYSEEYIKSAELNTKIAKAIWPDHVKKIPRAKLNENRKLYMSFWYNYPGQSDGIKPTVVSKRFRGKIDKPNPVKEETVNKKPPEKQIDADPDWNPKDRMRVDASDIPDPEPDEEFLRELREINGDIYE